MGYMIDKPKDIASFRYMTLLVGLRSEIKGVRLTNKARTCYSIIKSEFGLKGNKQSVLEQYEKILSDMHDCEDYVEHGLYARPNGSTNDYYYCGKCNALLQTG